MKESKTRRDYVGLYGSFYDAIQALPEEEDRKTMWQALCEYEFANKTPALFGTMYALFIAFKGDMDRLISKQDNGRMGGRPLKIATEPLKVPQRQAASESETKPNDNLNITEIKPNDNLNITETLQEIEVEKEVSFFKQYNSIFVMSDNAGQNAFEKSIKDRVNAAAIYGPWADTLNEFINYMWQAIRKNKDFTYSKVIYNSQDLFIISQRLTYSSVQPILSAISNRDIENRLYYSLGVICERVKQGWILGSAHVEKQISEKYPDLIETRKKNSAAAAQAEGENHTQTEYPSGNITILPLPTDEPVTECEQFLTEQMRDYISTITSDVKADSELQAKWNKILTLIKPEVTQINYDLYFATVKPISVYKDVLYLLASTHAAKMQILRENEKLQESIYDVMPDVSTGTVLSAEDIKDANVGT